MFSFLLFVCFFFNIFLPGLFDIIVFNSMRNNSVSFRCFIFMSINTDQDNRVKYIGKVRKLHLAGVRHIVKRNSSGKYLIKRSVLQCEHLLTKKLSEKKFWSKIARFFVILRGKQYHQHSQLFLYQGECLILVPTLYEVLLNLFNLIANSGCSVKQRLFPLLQPKSKPLNNTNMINCETKKIPVLMTFNDAN